MEAAKPATFCLMAILFLTLTSSVSSCPLTCSCQAEGRGQRVSCVSGNLSDIMTKLPHNTQHLLIKELTSTHALQRGEFKKAKIPPSILQLSVTHSAILQINESVFSPALTSLQELDLSYNGIRSISEQAFLGLSRLQSLNLSGNHLVDLGEMLQPLVSLQRLDLSFNFIPELKVETFRSQTSLSWLRLDGNRLRRLTGDPFKPLAFVSELRLRSCSIFSIANNFFSSVSKMHLLDLGDNMLSGLPHSADFVKLEHFNHLFLDGNQLLNLLPGQFADLSLLTLSLARNRLTSLSPAALKGLTVEGLDLSQNKLLEVTPESLQPVAAHLAALNLAHNPLRHLHPDAFQGLPLLKTLNMSACSLTYLPAKTFTSLFSLRSLDVSWNHLQNVSQDMVKVFNRLSQVNLRRNSWHCDCHIVPLRDWLKSRASALKLLCLPGQEASNCSSLQCSSPDKVVGVSLWELDDSHVEKCEKGVNKGGLPVPIQISIVLACLLLSLGMLLLAMYLWRKGRTKKNLKRVFQKRRKPDSHFEEDEENEKFDPFPDCDNESLKESHRSFVFRNYFDRMVTDPKLLEPTSPSQVASPEGRGHQRDSMYSSNPSLYETSHNSHSVVVGIESTV